MQLKSKFGGAVLACMLVSHVNALNVQLQLQLTGDAAERVPVNDAKLSAAAAALLAVKHFNDRAIRPSPVITLPPTCNPATNLTVEIVDTMSDEKVALRAYLEAATSPPPPDIVIGALTSYETVPLALTASVMNTPIISYGATSQRLDDSERYSTFLRTIPSDRTVAIACCQLFSSFGYEHVSVLYADDDYGSAYKDAISESCRDRDVPVYTRPVSFRVGNAASVQQAVETLKTFESNIIVAIAYEDDVGTAVAHAASIDMIGEGKLWVFTDAADTPTLEGVAQDPLLASVLDGNIRVLAQGTVRGNGHFTKFMTEWDAIAAGVTDQSKADLTFIQDQLRPIAPTVVLPKEFFGNGDGSIDPAAAYVYDAMMAAGIAACEPRADGVTLLEAIKGRTTPIVGVSGSIAFSDNGSRGKCRNQQPYVTLGKICFFTNFEFWLKLAISTFDGFA
jgi:ABC-type branched-subunit amino acid transport system substrate-binding protein